MNLQKSLKDTSWKNLLKEEFQSPYFQTLEENLSTAYEDKTIYPTKENIFTALNLTSFENLKVVILGQDPYHGPNQAHGLSFSVQKEIKIPPSLVNIYKELESDLNIKPPTHGFLESWAKKGVLLLNNQLTVEAGKPMSHKDIGWAKFTDKIIEIIDREKENIVFILWGAPAQKKASFVNPKKHLLLKSVHPSPLSSYRGFFGSRPFSQTNEYLISKDITPIDWTIK
jgi:uracil-DNA glycosylase